MNLIEEWNKSLAFRDIFNDKTLPPKQSADFK